MKSVTLAQLFAASGGTLVTVTVAALAVVLTPMRGVADEAAAVR